MGNFARHTECFVTEISPVARARPRSYANLANARRSGCLTCSHYEKSACFTNFSATLTERACATIDFVKRYGSTVLTIVCIAVAALGLFNVYADNDAVVQDAQRTACGPSGPACGAQVTSQERTPFGQTFTVHTPTGSVGVTCRRSAILVGGYSCKRG
jgi:hypothetical protein